MPRAIRTAGLALAIVAVGATSVPAAVEPGGEQAAQPPSSRPPSTSVAVRATSAQAAVPTSTSTSTSSPARPRFLAVPAPTLVAAALTGETASAPAVPAVDVDDRSPGWQQRLGAAALARLDYPVEALGVQISFLPARAGYLGLTYPKERRIEMYVREGVTVDDLARNTAHELGHVVDWARNTPSSRALYMQIRGITPRGWFACSGCTDLSTPAGDFAEAFSFWLMDGAFPSRSRIGSGSPTAEQLEQLIPLFSPA